MFKVNDLFGPLGGTLYPRILVVLSLGLFVLLGPAAPGTAQVGAGAGQATASAETLRPGDALLISVWPNNEYSGEFTIEETGNVYLPLIGTVQATDVTVGQLRAELRRLYGEAVRNPVVTITPMYRVSITGSVQRPGIHVITPAHTLFDVIGLSGGFTSSADTENVRVVRPGEVVEYDALRALETGEGMDVIRLRSGDHIIVPAQQPPRFTWRMGFEATRTIATLVLLYDRVFGND